jgi:siroheme synthase-like protein
VAGAARARGQWCTVADRPALCDFTMPSVGRRGPITVAVSTSGKAPALAARLRRRFEAQIWPEDLVIADGVQVLRGHLPAGKARMKLLRGLVAVAETVTTSIRKGLSRPFYRGQASVFNPAARRVARSSVRKAYTAASGGAR